MSPKKNQSKPSAHKTRAKLRKRAPTQETEIPDYWKPVRFAEPASSDFWPADPGPPDVQRNARKSYLRAVAKLKPEVLDSLRENVLPSFIDIYDVGHNLLSGKLLTRFENTLMSWYFLTKAGYSRDDPEWLRRQYERIGMVPLVASNFPSRRVAKPILNGLKTLVYTFQDWSSGWWWLYQAEWWHDHALQTLAKWHRESADENLDWLYELEYQRPELSTFSPFVFGYYPFRPNREPWREYERRLRTEFDKAAEDYRKRITAQWSSGPGEDLRLAREKFAVTHFDMLVDLHFNHKTQKQLAGKYGYSIANINEALRSLCYLLPVRYKRKGLSQTPSH